MSGNRYADAAEFRARLRRFMRRSEERARAAGLTPPQYLLLLQIAGSESESATVSELVERLALTQSAVTELVQRAEQAGLIERTGSATDARVVHLSLTGHGAQKLAEVYDSLGPERKGFLAIFEANDI